MLAPVDFRSARAVVEFGPGTGAFTRPIADRLQPHTRYLGIELNPIFCRTLAHGFPRLEFVHGSVADLTRILAQQGVTEVDAIVCGLPWASLPIALQEQVFAAMDHALAPAACSSPSPMCMAWGCPVHAPCAAGFAAVSRRFPALRWSGATCRRPSPISAARPRFDRSPRPA